MRRAIHHREHHRAERVGWLRAAVLGADDGIVSTASLLVGVAAAGTPRGQILIAGIAGLVAGAMSMAAEEYVSVSSQADSDEADLARERHELATDRGSERPSWPASAWRQGLEPALAQQVADQLIAHDALGPSARDELGISDRQRARPVQAALTSAVAFAAGAALPLLVMLAAPAHLLATLVTTTSLAFLAILGWLAARAAGPGPAAPCASPSGRARHGHHVRGRRALRRRGVGLRRGVTAQPPDARSVHAGVHASGSSSSEGAQPVEPQDSTASSSVAAPTRHVGQRHQQVRRQRRDERFVHAAQLGELSSAPAPASTTTFAATSPARSRARSESGSRSGADRAGRRPSTCVRSTTAWRAIANVSCAWRAHVPSTPDDHQRAGVEDRGQRRRATTGCRAASGSSASTG